MKQLPLGPSSAELIRVRGGLSFSGSGSSLDPVDQPAWPIALPPSLS